MYLNENWTYMVELKGPPDYIMGMVMLDLSIKDDRMQIDAFVDEKGCLRCMLGLNGWPENERREILRFHEYWGDMPFNNRFPFFGMVSIRDFVGRLCDAGKFDGDDESDIREKKKHYGL